MTNSIHWLDPRQSRWTTVAFFATRLMRRGTQRDAHDVATTTTSGCACLLRPSVPNETEFKRTMRAFETTLTKCLDTLLTLKAGDAGGEELRAEDFQTFQVRLYDALLKLSRFASISEEASATRSAARTPCHAVCHAENEGF